MPTDTKALKHASDPQSYRAAVMAYLKGFKQAAFPATPFKPMRDHSKIDEPYRKFKGTER